MLNNILNKPRQQTSRRITDILLSITHNKYIYIYMNKYIVEYFLNNDDSIHLKSICRVLILAT